MAIFDFQDYVNSNQLRSLEDQKKKISYYYWDYISWLVFEKNQKTAPAHELMTQLSVINQWVMSNAIRENNRAVFLETKEKNLIIPWRNLDVAWSRGSILSILSIVVLWSIKLLTSLNMPAAIFPCVIFGTLFCPTLFTMGKAIISGMFEKPTGNLNWSLSHPVQSQLSLVSQDIEEIVDLSNKTKSMLAMQYDAHVSRSQSALNEEVELEGLEEMLRLTQKRVVS